MLSPEKKEHFLSFFGKLISEAENFNLSFKPNDFSLNLVNGNTGLRLIVKNSRGYSETEYENSKSLKTILDKALMPIEVEYGAPNYQEWEDIECKTLLPTLSKGSKFVSGLLLNSKKEHVTIEQLNGKVMVVVLWEKNNTESSRFIKHLHHIFEKNYIKWSSKVMLVMISQNDKIDRVMQQWRTMKVFSESRYKHIVNHFFIQMNSKISYLQLYGGTKVPHAIFVDFQGIIQQCGLSDLNEVEGYITQLLEPPDLSNDVSSVKDQSEEIGVGIKLFDDLNILKENFLKKYHGQLNLKITFDVQITSDWEDIFVSGVHDTKISAEVREKEYQAILDTVKKYYDTPPSWFHPGDLKVIDTFTITPGDICYACRQTIPAEIGQYYCYWCNISFCQNCTESLEAKTGREKLIHKEHNLLYFLTRNPEHLTGLDKYKLGKNLFTSKKDNELQYRHNAICNGCSGQFNRSTENSRYLCVTCRPGQLQSGGFADYCLPCVKTLRENGPQRREIVDNYPEHAHESHIYLRLVFNVSDYYTY